jgi:hypothetical protein
MAARQRTRNGARDMQVNNILAGEYESTRIDLLEYFTTRYRRPTLLKLVAENPRNEERVRNGQLPIYFAFVNFGSIEANRAAFRVINNAMFRNLPLRVHINRELEDGTPITTDVRLARRTLVEDTPIYNTRQVQSNAEEEAKRELVRRNIDALGQRPSTTTTTTTTVVTTTTNAPIATVTEPPAPQHQSQSTLASEPPSPSPHISRPTAPTQMLVQAPEQAQTATSNARRAPRRETFDDALARARRQLEIAPGTLGTHAEETRLRRYPNELIQFVTRQHELEQDSSDNESIISARNPQKCQQCGRRDTTVHKAACDQRERESFATKIKLVECGICLEQFGQARPEEMVFTPCGHILHTRCYNNNRAVGVNPNLCPTCKSAMPQLHHPYA